MKTLFCIVICSLCLSAYSQDSNSELLKKDIINLEKKINRLELSQYLQYCKEVQEIPPVYALKGITEKYNADPKCNAARKCFEEANKKIGDILKQFPEYRVNMSPQALQMLFNELHNNSPEYRKVRITRDSALLCSNLIILETIINDYSNRDAILPTTFITPADLEIIRRQIPEYALLTEKLSIMKELYTKKVKQEIEEKYGIGNASKP